ncbi:polyhydroxyalkanoic acid system family protein [Sphingomonas canadensis]|uniref:Polyhydroxyalkanoic acid system family protein n=1 Tax=Sphingomonas canadensis TaxID=1219257 RepID=A0ABW3HB67_9SPHN|nr:polyhydroxyalkanoic acid system family protein [Sphingomonas canadensis]MCW3838390.1 polyhydroxyalkanoic acid system family protein [Sphingomonas canadensis]
MDPLIVEIPHGLGRDGARARIAAGAERLADMVPGGTMSDAHWEGDTYHFRVATMGVAVPCRLYADDGHVRAELELPGYAAMFAGKIRDKLIEKGAALLA